MRTTLPFWALLSCLAGLLGCGGSSAASPAYASSPMSEPAPAPGMMGGMAKEYGESDGDGIADKADRLTFAGEEMRGDLTRATGAELAKGAPPPPAKPAPAGQPAPGAPSTPSTQEQPPGQAVSVRAPLLIYTAQITMAVFEVNASLAKVEAIARDVGGFLARRDDASIVIRVPVSRFDDAVKLVEGVGDMLHRNVAVEDVTEEYVDLEIRVRNARAIRDRLEKLLEKAATVEESVTLERELGRVAGEIERIEGRLKLLRDRAAFSTITVSFQPRPRESIDPAGPRLPVVWLNELGLGRLLNL
ncbi:MAG: DUF4349 domain-containing protein [Polyangiaceae bacterium]|nr:DUF4349 domain-containing protein [Polyangiaceae bacterium]